MSLVTDPFTGSRYNFGGGNPLSNIELDGHGWLSALGHAALDAAGMIPVADVANGVWYAADGETGKNPYHYTVGLPQRVTDAVTDLLNEIFGARANGVRRMGTTEPSHGRVRPFGRTNSCHRRTGTLTSDALKTLLEVGERQSESGEILRAVGSALAVLAHQGATITEFDMRNLQGVTYDAYCGWEP